MATLADLISSASSLDRDTSWIVMQVAKMRPAEDFLKMEASVVTEPIPEFRKKAGGLIRIGDIVIGAGSGKGYLDGKVGPWLEMKPLIAERLGGQVKAAKIKTEATAPKVAKKTESKAVTVNAVDDPRAYNEVMNSKLHGDENTRKIWINYALLEKSQNC